MSMPNQFEGKLKLPAIVAPMFLTSGPELVVETCRSGLVGTFPALNQRSSEGYAEWLVSIKSQLAETNSPTPFGVNLIVHKSNPRLQADIEVSVEHQVPLIITSLGAVRDVVDAVHSYGGLVFHDVINIRHAQKAAEAGVDGIIAVCAGAGGHAGTLSPFALVSEIRKFFDGTIILAGAMSTGKHIAAARMMGADLAYLGTRFIATKEAMVEDDFKNMIIDTTAKDIFYTSAISGVNANFLKPSIINAGLDPDNLSAHEGMDMEKEAKVWKDIWSAGQGVGSIDEIVSAADLCQSLIAEYKSTYNQASLDPYL